MAYLGQTLLLVLATDSRAAEQMGDELRLPLPPEATPRQVRDAAESWLRDEALRIFSDCLAKSMPSGRHSPRIVLSFGKGGDWARREGDLLRCHWRLIEQPLPVVVQVLAKAGATTVGPGCNDLFTSSG